MSAWLYARIAMILIATTVSCFVPLAPQARPQLDWVALAVIFFGCVLILPLIVGFQRFNTLNAKVWDLPSWTSNPFNFREPIQFFYLGAWLSIAQGLVILIRLVLTSVPFYVEALVPLAMGTGVWLGIKLTIGLFASKFLSSC